MPAVPEPPDNSQPAWPTHVYAALSVTAAVLIVSFVATVLCVVARWIAHVTGVWPL